MFFDVSIPNGLPRPFRPGNTIRELYDGVKFQSRTGFPGHSDAETGAIGRALAGFNPERASQAIPT